jgi:hypothetical protein
MCEKSTVAFVNKLAEIYTKHDKITNKNEAKKQILKWVKTGKESPIVNNLLSGEESKHFPIWWSGFWIENPDPVSNPVNDMKSASQLLHGYSSLDTRMGFDALEQQNSFWKACSKKDDFKWGTYISNTYTKMALRKNPKNIGLFVNKDIDAFLLSDFFKTEISLINSHYKDINKKVKFHIFNLKDNCKEIINKLKDVVTNIKFKCYNDCRTLAECVVRMKKTPAGNKSKTTKSTKYKKKKVYGKRQTKKRRLH